jgi:hypothetical protein
MHKIKFIATYPKKPWRGGRVEVDIPGNKFPSRIEVYPKTKMVPERECKDEIEHYTVNWSAFGSVSTDIAALYVKGISHAVNHANRLTKRFKGQDYT